MSKPKAPSQLEQNTEEKTGTKPGEAITPSEQPDEAKIEDLGKPDPETNQTKSERESSFGTTGWWDRAKDKASEVGEAAKKRTRRIQNRSAEHDAQKARQMTERITAEVGNTIAGLVQSSVSLIVGGTYGVISGTAKSASPVHAQTLRASDNLYHAGSWSELHQGVKYEGNIIDWFEVEFNEEAASILGCEPGETEFIVNQSAVTTKMELDGERVQVISSPLYEPNTDKLVGILAFVNEGDFAGQILLHVEEK